MKYLVANWKAHKTKNDVLSWLQTWRKIIDDSVSVQTALKEQKIHIIICPSFPFLDLVSEQIKSYQNISIGAQDLSMLDKGSYTGEVPAFMLPAFAKYVIVGHSERRKYFNENESTLAAKIAIAEKYHIASLFCISEISHMISSRVPFVCYEPIHAIGTDNNEPLEKVLYFKSRLYLTPEQLFLYGGSVDEYNIMEYLSTDEIDGAIIGTASLDPHTFGAIVSILASEKEGKEDK